MKRTIITLLLIAILVLSGTMFGQTNQLVGDEDYDPRVTELNVDIYRG